MARAPESKQVIGGQVGSGVLQSLTQGRALAENRLSTAVQASAQQSASNSRMQSAGGGGPVQGDSKKIAAMQIAAQDRRAAEAVTAREEDREYQSGREDKQRNFLSEQANLVREYNDAKDSQDEERLTQFHKDRLGLDEAKMMIDNMYKREDRSMLATWIESQGPNEESKRELFYKEKKQQETVREETTLRTARRERIALQLEGRESALTGSVEGVTKDFNEIAATQQLGDLTLDRFNPDALPQLIADISQGKLKERQLVAAMDIISELKTAGLEAVKTGKGRMEAVKKEARDARRPFQVIPVTGDVSALAIARRGNQKLIEAEMTISRLLESKSIITDAKGNPTNSTVGQFATRMYDIKNQTTPSTSAEDLTRMFELDNPVDWWKSQLTTIQNPGRLDEAAILSLSPEAQKYVRRFETSRHGSLDEEQAPPSSSGSELKRQYEQRIAQRE